MPILESPALDGTLTDAIMNGLGLAAKLGSQYWTAKATIEQQKQLYNAAKAGLPASAATGAAAAAQNLTAYMPYIFGGLALVAAVTMLKK